MKYKHAIESYIAYYTSDKKHLIKQIIGMVLVIVGISLLWNVPWYEVIGIWLIAASASITNSSNLEKYLMAKINILNKKCKR